MLTRAERDAWVAALRSGEHKQTQGALARVDDTGAIVGYCCIGVACQIWGIPFQMTRVGLAENNHRTQPAYEAVRNKCHIDGEARGNTHTLIGGLAEQNDKGKNFNEIAVQVEALPVQEDA